jgi:co-chaperonin GroES (HSP10)|tara:strand:- start:83 stop:664 length:582 start_codon:yes stop_codon:yes gene_type:complete
MEILPIGDFVYVELEKEEENTHVLDDGTKIWLDTSYDRYVNARQYGTVKMVSVNIKKRVEDNLTLKKGDKVYFHHHVIDERMASEFGGENVYKVHYDQLYCYVRNEKITMLQDYVFVEPIQLEDKIGSLYIQSKESTKRGRVKFCNQFSKDEGFKNGDEIIFIKNANYDMIIEGEKLFRMKNNEILALTDGIE